jgi:hypothetical protein
MQDQIAADGIAQLAGDQVGIKRRHLRHTGECRYPGGVEAA